MPMPQGTYLHTHRTAKTQYAAAKTGDASAKERTRDRMLSGFLGELNQYPESEYLKWRDDTMALAISIEKGDAGGGSKRIGEIAAQTEQLRKFVVLGRDTRAYQGPYRAFAAEADRLLNVAPDTLSNPASAVAHLLALLHLALRVIRITKSPGSR